MPRIAAISVYVDDLARAKSFYTDALGFTVAEEHEEAGIVELGHDGVSLVLCRAERPHRLAYSQEAGTVIGLATDRLDADLASLKAKNAELVMPEPTPFPMGRFIAVRDPSGNVVELLEFRK